MLTLCETACILEDRAESNNLDDIRVEFIVKGNRSPCSLNNGKATHFSGSAVMCNNGVDRLTLSPLPTILSGVLNIHSPFPFLLNGESYLHVQFCVYACVCVFNVPRQHVPSPPHYVTKSHSGNKLNTLKRFLLNVSIAVLFLRAES